MPERLRMPAKSYHANLCGVGGGAERIGHDHDTSICESPAPGVCEATNTDRAVAKDFYILWLQPAAIGRQGRSIPQNGVRRSRLGVLIDCWAGRR